MVDDAPHKHGSEWAIERRPISNAKRDSSPFYILATSPQADEHSRVLKHGDTFAVFDHFGDITPEGLAEEGIYHEGTRYLSSLVLGLGRKRPLFLSSTVKEENDLLAVDLTNLDVSRGNRIVIPRGTLHVSRLKFLWKGACFERIRIRNYGMSLVETNLSLHFEADFADIFEVRGIRRKQRGTLRDPEIEDATVLLAYEGLDRVVRRTRLVFSPRPDELTDSEASFGFRLPPREELTICMTVVCEGDGERRAIGPFDEVLRTASAALDAAVTRGCTIETSNEQFNSCLSRAAADLHMLITDTLAGPYPYAGVPWFSTVFGRDGILTALECLWLNPGLARGVLAFLASTQATEVNPEQDAEPGKILHEMRRGEMAALKEIPFGRYYGSVDATPLFVLLAGAYYERTGDRAFIETLWPHIQAALQWIDAYGDADGDGFVEYYRRSPEGLVQQGWKDSHDSVFHADGTPADGPIALCEVQGYVYAAKRAAAELAGVLGHDAQAKSLRSSAEQLCEKFDRCYWSAELGTYALALDGGKRPCLVRTSNPGHCLLTGIAKPERAKSVAQTLLDGSSFSGWGIRTLAASEARYNPMSYHNGSIWPHDNALAAAGLARYGLKDAVLHIQTGLFDACLFMELHRLPELFCGFPRRSGEGPVLYPVACAPQAWAAASFFSLLQSCLGLGIRGRPPRIHFEYPILPPFLKEVRITNLVVGDITVDLLLIRHDNDVGINVLRRTGDVEIRMVK